MKLKKTNDHVSFYYKIKFLFTIYWCNLLNTDFLVLQISDGGDTASTSSARKVILRSSYGPLDNFIVRSLSNEDKKKFHILLIQLTVSCGWALHWVNKPEAKELFEFLNPFLKLPDRQTLGGEILKDAVSEKEEAMEIALKEDPVGVTLTFDGWTNVKNEQLLEVVIMISEGRPFVCLKSR